ncbi:MAG: hypothetical protein OEW64_14175, partial [Gammaproteobacteria bacterium]|nr:hypothetical protein [Gammaproteobacteria bacterium]
LDQRENILQAAKANQPGTVIALGPFLDRDEAEIVESQAHLLLSRYQVQRGRYRVNPLDVSEFREWIDAQILPVRVYEKTVSARQLLSLGQMDRRFLASLNRSAAANGEVSDLSVEPRS